METVAERVGIVVDAAGDRSHDIELNIRVFLVSVTEDPTSVIDDIASSFGVAPTWSPRRRSRSSGTITRSPRTLVRRREELGFSYVVVGPDDVDSFAPVVAALAGA